MAQQVIGIGTVVNDDTGDPLRTAFDKSNDNFSELYALQSLTINAGAVDFAGAGSNENRISAAIAAAVALPAPRVRVPAAMLPYDASLVSFDNSIQMTREWGDDTVYDVKAYGARGDRVLSDSVSFQTAVAGAQAAFGTVSIPEPDVAYLIDEPILVTSRVLIRGTGNYPRICGSGLGAGEYIFDVGVADPSRIENIQLSNMALEQAGSGPWASGLIRLRNVANSQFSDIQMKEAKYGIHIQGLTTFSLSFDNVFASYGSGSEISDACIYFDDCHGGSFNFWGGNMQSALKGVRVSGSSGSMSSLNFYGTNFESCGEYSFFCNVHDIAGVAFIGCRSEANTAAGGYDFYFEPPSGGYARGISFTGACYLQSETCDYAIVMTNAGGGVCHGADIHVTAEGYNVAVVKCESNGGQGSFIRAVTGTVPAVVNTVQDGVLILNGTDPTGAALGSQSWQPPLTTPAVNGASTDLSSVIALCNQLRAALVANRMAT